MHRQIIIADNEVTNISVDQNGIVHVGLTTQPANTCSSWGWYMKFDGTTQGGGIMYTHLMTAKATRSRVNGWYTSSTAPGTTQENNQCNIDTISVLTGVSIP